jgi:hypothetical protein
MNTPPNNTEPALDGLIEAALKIAHQDGAQRRILRDALIRGDVAQALRSACPLVNVEPSGHILGLIRKADTG